MSDLHPTNTMGVEGDVVVRAGTQYVTALNKDERDVIEKQSRKASAEIKLSLFMLDVWGELLLSWGVHLFTLSALRSLNSDISNLVLLLPT